MLSAIKEPKTNYILHHRVDFVKRIYYKLYSGSFQFAIIVYFTEKIGVFPALFNVSRGIDGIPVNVKTGGLTFIVIASDIQLNIISVISVKFSESAYDICKSVAPECLAGAVDLSP